MKTYIMKGINESRHAGSTDSRTRPERCYHRTNLTMGRILEVHAVVRGIGRFKDRVLGHEAVGGCL